MADTRKITIEIVTRDADSPNAKPKTTEDEKESNAKQLAKSILLNQAYNQAKRNITNVVERTVNRQLTLKEDYLGENIYNGVKTTISKITGFGNAIIGGYTAGAIATPAIGIATAVVSGIGWGVNELINYQSRMSAYHQQLNASNFQMEFGRTRAGLTNGSRGTEN